MARGGKRPNAGRKKGSVGKVTQELRTLASAYTEEALEILVKIARDSESDAAKVSAVREILDRGHGKPKQDIGVMGDPNHPIYQDITIQWK